MNADVRRIFEMGSRAESFSAAQPDTDAGASLSLAKLKEVRVRMEEIAAAQRTGLIDSRAAAAEKKRLRRVILQGPIAHLAEVGKAAAKEQHELGTIFRRKPDTDSYVGFRTNARGMQAEAEANKDVLAKYGLSESVLAQFGQLLDQFDAALALGQDGRTAHTGATRELDALAKQVVQIVRVMDARNRQRFEGDQKLLGSWISARTVLGKRSGSVAAESPAPVEGGTPVAGGDVRPAA